MGNIERQVARQVKAMTRREIITKAIDGQLSCMALADILAVHAKTHAADPARVGAARDVGGDGSAGRGGHGASAQRCRQSIRRGTQKLTVFRPRSQPRARSNWRKTWLQGGRHQPNSQLNNPDIFNSLMRRTSLTVADSSLPKMRPPNRLSSGPRTLGGPDRALKRPMADVVDLLLHGA
jgi:hypothetical protein